MADNEKPPTGPSLPPPPPPSVPATGQLEADRSWLRCHILEVVLGILVAVASFLAVRAINQIDTRLENIEKDGKTLDTSFAAFKKDVQKIQDDLSKAIKLVASRVDEETSKTVGTIIGVNKKQSSLESSLSATQAEVRETKGSLRGLQAQFEKVAAKADLENLERKIENVDADLHGVKSDTKVLTADSKSADKEQILTEAKRRLNQLDEQYLYSKAHAKTIIKIPPVSSFFGGTAEVVPQQEEFQVSRTVEVDFQKGTLILRGRLKKQSTKNQLRSLLGSIRGVERVDDSGLEVQGSED